MNKDFKKAVIEARKISLSKEEFAAMRSDLTAFMSRNPAENLTSSQVFLWKFRQFFSGVFALRNVSVIAILIILFAGIGTSAAAELALPGDFLYPVKIKFNEEVRGLVAISAKSKTEWQMERAKRRLEEAKKLEDKGLLSDSIKENLKRQMDKHIKEARVLGGDEAVLAPLLDEKIELKPKSKLKDAEIKEQQAELKSVKDKNIKPEQGIFADDKARFKKNVEKKNVEKLREADLRVDQDHEQKLEPGQKENEHKNIDANTRVNKPDEDRKEKNGRGNVEDSNRGKNRSK